MHIKVSSLPISLFTALTLAVVTLSGCTQTPPPKQSPVSTFLPSPTIVDTNAPPAVYKLSNLRSQLMADSGPNVYIFYIDVENTGGRPGNYSVTYRFDNGPVEPEKDYNGKEKVIQLDPGIKKQIRLIGPELKIITMGQDYDKGTTEVRQHTLYCGDLSLPVTLAERPTLYMNSNTTVLDFKGGNITVSGEANSINANTTIIGEVKNISGDGDFIEYVKNIKGNITLYGGVQNSTGNITAGGKIVIVNGTAKSSSENFTVSGSVITVIGEVKNISNRPIENVIAVVDMRIAAQAVLASKQLLFPPVHAEAPVGLQVISPGQTTPFKLVLLDIIPINLSYSDYQVSFKDAAGATIRTVSVLPQ